MSVGLCRYVSSGAATPTFIAKHLDLIESDSKPPVGSSAHIQDCNCTTQGVAGRFHELIGLPDGTELEQSIRARMLWSGHENSN